MQSSFFETTAMSFPFAWCWQCRPPSIGLMGGVLHCRVHQVVVVAASAGFRSSTPEFAGSKGDCRRGVRRLMCSQRDGETERAEVAETH